MIEVYKQVPRVYYKESRDFQLLGRLFEVIFNHNKMNSDLIYESLISNEPDRKLISLLTYANGFETIHEYDNNDLFRLAKSFRDIISNKGTQKSIEDAIRLLLKSQNIDKKFDVKYVAYEENKETGKKYPVFNVEVDIPAELNDIILLEDLFDYILPTGWTYTIIRTDIGTEEKRTDIRETDVISSNSWNGRTDSNLGTIYEQDEETPPSTNESGMTYIGTVFRKDEEEEDEE